MHCLTLPVCCANMCDNSISCQLVVTLNIGADVWTELAHSLMLKYRL
jgi:hypothetical protein